MLIRKDLLDMLKSKKKTNKIKRGHKNTPVYVQKIHICTYTLGFKCTEYLWKESQEARVGTE